MKGAREKDFVNSWIILIASYFWQLKNQILNT